ncbi:unnamed protein product [Calypogeia fissa]
MLTTVYKLIAKLLALRLKVFLPDMIDPQQTGFIPGRHILENISTAWLTMDWIRAKRFSALFLKLDFEKGFDRVNHDYLWSTLSHMGLGRNFIRLVQSLLTDAYSRVHINGSFSTEIQLRRGVRQGCPISPLLFVLSTHPLMRFLLTELRNNWLQGIKITDNLTVCYRLFADDLGVFIPASELAFNQLKDALSIYELASGARLNLAKFVIIPLALPDIPIWLRQSGGVISEAGMVHKYLGAPIGWDLKPTVLHNFCFDKLGARLALWSARLLTFTGRVLLIKHVFQAIPVYHSMLLHAPDMVCTKMNRLCKDFLWGFNKQGGRKLPLVAWDKLALPKIFGGLGFKSLKYHSRALLSRWFLQALDNPSSEWALLLHETLRLTRWINHQKVKKFRYQFSDLVLLGKPNSFGKLHYTGSLWKAWTILWDNLLLCEGAHLKGRWLIEDLLRVLPGFQDLPLSDQKDLTCLIGRLGIKIVQNLWSSREGRWRLLLPQLHHIRGLDTLLRDLAERFLSTVTNLSIQTDDALPLPPSWQWTDRLAPLQQFLIPNGRIYKQILPLCHDFERLNRIWHCNYSTDGWNAWWNALWTSDLSSRLKVFTWRIISQGFYTMKKAAQINKGEPYCKLCSGQALSSIWHARNKHVLEDKQRTHHMEVTLNAAIDHIRAQTIVLFPGRKKVRLNMAKQLLQQWRTTHLAGSRNQLHHMLTAGLS